MRIVRLVGLTTQLVAMVLPESAGCCFHRLSHLVSHHFGSFRFGPESPYGPALS